MVFWEREIDMMKKEWVMVAGAAVILFFMGCSTANRQQPELIQNWGRSAETAKYTQILNHDAEKNRAPVTGIDGERAMVNTQKTIEGDDKGNKSSSPKLIITKEN